MTKRDRAFFHWSLGFLAGFWIDGFKAKLPRGICRWFQDLTRIEKLEYSGRSFSHMGVASRARNVTLTNLHDSSKILHIPAPLSLMRRDFAGGASPQLG
jgi:hypothetical protein